MSNFVLDDLKNAFKKDGNSVHQLIIINIAVFIVVNLINNLFYPPNAIGITDWLALPSDIIAFLTHFWTMLTYMFLHLDLFHIFFNMLWLYWFGSILITYKGNKSLVSTYILGGICGGLFYLISYNLFFPVDGLLGASAGVMAVVFAVATLLPNHNMHLIFIGPVRLKYIALAALVLTTFLNFSDNTGGKIAHLGGAIYGYFYIRQLQSGVDISRFYHRIIDSIALLFTSSRASNMKVHYKNPQKKTDEEYNVEKKLRQQKIDQILDKISKSGYDSLTKEEKSFLFKEGNGK